eukprot:CAMPEP_0170528016 /NCGR_PEP_ID=MMETSP0209-20121228/13527_1 /TAXON_ID=665100 ORGANISM="Litonotus pictus, Strain P1" /NCGR_SAMPLE_ID=MMETSP0209 /ASSEMBLY_ACC=CAM_ASM_000301 /LENGTH=316 /DNA_ID=CAMNT_0010818971 /DNA_START=57 /DNA_END=1007 /DNA_ORIENTATION=+
MTNASKKSIHSMNRNSHDHKNNNNINSINTSQRIYFNSPTRRLFSKKISSKSDTEEGNPKAFKLMEDFSFKNVNPIEELNLFLEEDPTPEDLFKSIRKKASSIQNIPSIDNEKITVFLSFDDLLLYSHVPDENFSMQFSPKLRDFDFKLHFQKQNSTVYVYLRDYAEEFLKFMKDEFNLVLYGTGSAEYNSTINSRILDKEGSVFEGRAFGEEQCHLYINEEQEHTELIRDINLFTDIPLSRKVILDNDSMSQILAPDNTIPFDAYVPDYFSPESPDETLLKLIDEFEQIKKYEDVRDCLIEKYNMRQIMINSKLL